MTQYNSDETVSPGDKVLLVYAEGDVDTATLINEDLGTVIVRRDHDGKHIVTIVEQLGFMARGAAPTWAEVEAASAAVDAPAYCAVCFHRIADHDEMDDTCTTCQANALTGKGRWECEGQRQAEENDDMDLIRSAEQRNEAALGGFEQCGCPVQTVHQPGCDGNHWPHDECEPRVTIVEARLPRWLRWSMADPLMRFAAIAV